MAQLMPGDYRNVEVMLDYESKRIVSFGKLTLGLVDLAKICDKPDFTKKSPVLLM